jgi:hypothetical protein
VQRTLKIPPVVAGAALKVRVTVLAVGVKNALSAMIAAAAIALAAENTHTELVVTPVIVAGAVVAVVAVTVPVRTFFPLVGITVPGIITGVPLIGVPYTAAAPGVPGTAATGPAT